nr:hypothetical protein [Tanacetum cinerariifolium]
CPLDRIEDNFLGDKEDEAILAHEEWVSRTQLNILCQSTMKVLDESIRERYSRLVNLSHTYVYLYDDHARCLNFVCSQRELLLVRVSVHDSDRICNHARVTISVYSLGFELVFIFISNRPVWLGGTQD